MSEIKWPYANEFGQEEHIESDVLVLGGGIAGCFAALSAARRALTAAEHGAKRKSSSRKRAASAVSQSRYFQMDAGSSATGSAQTL